MTQQTLCDYFIISNIVKNGTIKCNINDVMELHCSVTYDLDNEN